MREFKENKDKNTELPSDSVINKYKDFSRLHANYDKVTKRPKKPIYKDPKLFILLLLILLLCIVFFSE